MLKRRWQQKTRKDTGWQTVYTPYLHAQAAITATQMPGQGDSLQRQTQNHSFDWLTRASPYIQNNCRHPKRRENTSSQNAWPHFTSACSLLIPMQQVRRGGTDKKWEWLLTRQHMHYTGPAQNKKWKMKWLGQTLHIRPKIEFMSDRNTKSHMRYVQLACHVMIHLLVPANMTMP